MLDTPKDILLQALTIVGFPDDKKEDFIAKFIEVCNKQFLSDLLDTFPEDKQKSLIDRLKEEKDPEKIKAILLENSSKDTIGGILKKSTKEVFKDYLQTVMPDLSEEKQVGLAKYFKTLSEETQDRCKFPIYTISLYDRTPNCYNPNVLIIDINSGEFV